MTKYLALYMTDEYRRLDIDCVKVIVIVYGHGQDLLQNAKFNEFNVYLIKKVRVMLL